MQNVRNFYDLEVWKHSNQLAIVIYSLTQKYPADERFGLVDQLRRAVASVSANIAEGFGRYHYKDKVKFYYQARGSLYEVQSFLLLSKELGYVSGNDLTDMINRSKKIERMIHGLIRSTRNT